MINKHAENPFVYLRLKCINETSDLVDCSLELLLDPVASLVLGDLVVVSDAVLAVLPLGDTSSFTGQYNVKVHSVNTDTWVVLDSHVDMLVNSESEVTRVAKVLGQDLVVLAAKSKVDELHGTFTADSHVARDVLVTTDRKGTDSVASLGEYRLVTGKLLEYGGGAGEAILVVSDRDVEDKLLNEDFPVGIVGLSGDLNTGLEQRPRRKGHTCFSAILLRLCGLIRFSRDNARKKSARINYSASGFSYNLILENTQISPMPVISVIA